MNYNKKSIEDIELSGKRVLCRCDFNVPTKAGRITSDKRIVAALPTIKYLIEHNAKVILCSHMGKPKGEWKPELSLKIVAARLSELLGQEVIMAADVAGEDAKAKAAALENGQVMLLENTRYIKGETKNDPELSRDLASMADIFVNDAFGTAHRAHSSTAGVADYLPAVSGFLVQKEVSIMGKALADPERPFVAIMGGSKVSDKLGLIGSFVGKCDAILVVGGMSYTFFKAMGGTIGSSICDDNSLGLVKGIIEDAESKGTKVYLPVDTVISDQFSNDGNRQVVTAGQIPDGFMGMDIGPKTVEKYTEILKDAKTIIWNGPAGVFEMSNFAKGTQGIARAVANSEAISIIGGGDSAAAIENLGLKDQVTHVSTGGGAAIQFLEGATLPGIACLQDKE